MDSEHLIIPVYLDTNALLDILATIEGGFSFVEKITANNSNAQTINTNQRSLNATFNIPNILKINLNPVKTQQSETQEVHGSERERYHTYGSLLNRLRMILFSKNAVKRFDGTNESWSELEPSDFVEIKGVFRPNPLGDSLKTLNRILDIVEPALKIEDKDRINLALLKNLLSDLEREDLRLFVIDMFTRGIEYKAVVTLFLDYLRDNSTFELSHKEFKLLGKVVRRFDQNSEEKLNLLSGTGFGGLGDQIINPFADSLNQLNEKGMRIPKIETELSPPLLQILPIAIYV